MNCYVCGNSAEILQTTTNYYVVDCQFCGTYKISQILVNGMQGRAFDAAEMQAILHERRKKLTPTESEPLIESWDEDFLEN